MSLQKEVKGITRKSIRKLLKVYGQQKKSLSEGEERPRRGYEKIREKERN